jgi:hypothetical protein
MTGSFLEIIVWEPLPAGEVPVRFQRRMATVRIKPHGAVVALDRHRKTITSVNAAAAG